MTAKRPWKWPENGEKIGGNFDPDQRENGGTLGRGRAWACAPRHASRKAKGLHPSPGAKKFAGQVRKTAGIHSCEKFSPWRNLNLTRDSVQRQIRLHHGDCLVGMSRVGTGTVDLILCDLPYGTTNCAWDTVLPFQPLWKQYRRVLKPRGAVVLTATQPFATELINSARNLFRYDLVWDKQRTVGFAQCRRQPLRAHELILVFYRRQPVYNPQGLIQLEKPRRRPARQKGGNVYHGLNRECIQEYTNYPRSILRFPFRGRREHPTQKPLEMMEYLIRTFTDPGGLVMDNCMGSGTTAVAALNSGRRFVGFELDERYYKIACRRVADRAAELTGK